MVDRLPAAPGTLWSSTEPTLPADNSDAFKTAPGRNIFGRIFNKGGRGREKATWREGSCGTLRDKSA